jgi:hypothetical protein
VNESPFAIADSDSFFTISADIGLLNLKAEPLPNGLGVRLEWSTSPGPADLEGYRVEKQRPGDTGWTTLGVTRSTWLVDPDGSGGAGYRLFAEDGWGREQLLGTLGGTPTVPLRAWPLPYVGGRLNIRFAASGGLGGGSAPAVVSLHDVSGRLIRHVVDGEFPAGVHPAIWDGRDALGGAVANGVYFLRVRSGGMNTEIKIPVLR